ncbi:hypothetical protein RCK67_24520, partial [Salmonella enterica subsp. enterica serovar 1,4,[5],12:i:-]
MGDPDNKRRGKAYLALFQDQDDLYDTASFAAHKKYLVGKGRVEDPESPLFKHRKPVTVDYEPPTI